MHPYWVGKQPGPGQQSEVDGSPRKHRHTSSGTESSESGAISLIQVVHFSTTTRSSPDGQFYSGSICEQERGNTITHIVDTSHRPVGSGPECGFLSYSRTYPGHIQRNSGHCISSFQQSLRVVALQRDFPENHPSVLSTSCGPVCKPNQQSTSSVCVSVPRPRSNDNRCIPLQLESEEELDFSSGSLDRNDSEQAQSRRSHGSHPSTPLEGTTRFLTTLEMLVDYPRRLAQQPRLISLPFDPEREHPLQHKVHLTVWLSSGKFSEQKDFRKRLQTYRFLHGVKPRKNAKQGYGELGLAGVLNGAPVPLLHL